MGAFHDPSRFPFVRSLEAAFASVRTELERLRAEDFVAAPDSLTQVADGYDETGWLWYALADERGPHPAHAARCPATMHALATVPGLVNAGFSWFKPGTHLYPHQGERPGVLRCHLPLRVPYGDCAIRSGADVRTWVPGECLVFDDTFLHDALR
jgi:beta-hydroxylase